MSNMKTCFDLPSYGHLERNPRSHFAILEAVAGTPYLLRLFNILSRAISRSLGASCGDEVRKEGLAD